MIFSLSDYFPEKIVFPFSENLPQFVSKRHNPILDFGIKKYVNLTWALKNARKLLIRSGINWNISAASYQTIYISKMGVENLRILRKSRGKPVVKKYGFSMKYMRIYKIIYAT